MKISAIRLFNLASLEGLHVIDFTEDPLLSSGIFAITGPTGAGKSTLLDALCLALYSEAPRYESVKSNQVQIKDVDGSYIAQNDPRAILRNGAAEGYAEVDFVGVDRKRYRSRWSVARARQKANGKLQPYKMSLIEIDNQQNLSETNTITLNKIAQLIGLDYNQFSKSVILAQGEFTAFLKADKDSKASLLEKLTGTEIYSEISKLVFVRHKEQDTQLKFLQSKADYIQLLSPEMIEEKKSLIEEKTLELKNTSKQLEQLDIVLKAYADLHDLEKKVEKCQDQLSESEKSLEKEEARIQHFHKINVLSPIRHQVQNLNRILEEIQNLQNSNQNLHDEIHKNVEQLALSEKSFSDAENQFKLQKTELVNARPQMEMALKLDVQIDEQTKNKKQFENEIEKSESQLKEFQSKCKENIDSLDQLKTQQTELQRWLDEKADKSPIVEHHQLIVSKLKDANTWQKNKLVYIQEIAQYEESIFYLNQEKKTLKLQIYHLSQQSTELDEKNQHLQTEKNKIDIDLISKQSLNLRAKIHALVQLQSDWKIYDKTRADLNKLLQEQQRLIDDNSTSQKKSKDLQSEIDTTQVVYQTQKELLEKIKLETSENVESLRAQLQPDTPCPVCGSHEHPYTLGHVFEKTFHTIESEVIKVEQKLLELEKLKVQVDTSIEKNHHQLKNIENQKSDVENHLTQYHQQVYQSEVIDEIRDVNEDEVQTFLSDLLKKLNEENQLLSKSVEQYQQCSKVIDQLQSKIQAIQFESKKLEQSLSANELKLQKSQDALNVQQDLSKEVEHNLNTVKDDLSPYFVHTDWMENWAKNPDDFVNRIQLFVKEWKDNSERFKNLDEQIGLKNSEILLQQSKIDQVQNEVKSLQTSLKTLLESIQKLKDERNKIFDGQDVAKVEEEFNAKIAKSEQLFEELKNECNRLTTHQAVLKSQLESAEKQKVQLDQEKISTQEKITIWLSKQNISDDVLTISELLTFTDEWYSNEKEFIEGLQSQHQQAQIFLKVSIANLNTHQAQFTWEIEESDLVNQIQSLKSQLEKCQELIITCKNELQNDQEEKLNKQSILQDIERQRSITENWARLNQLIGSQEGKKFKTFAQEYTLDILVEYANMHLRSLSKRYLLERIPDHLALQVIDMDMGEEIRTIYSLSGGETFLISLALALGLSSLSSKTLNVESIFIDEGFGTLDPQTLSMAMDALENLYQQGRKVGVISHVQEMTERIPVKIQVSKVQSGRSTIEIVS